MMRSLALVLLACVLAGCATRPVNPPIEKANVHAGYRYLTQERMAHPSEDLIVLAFSGGGTRAAERPAGGLTWSA
jgi:NTE family protein